MSPPGPFRWGSTTCSVNAAATAASNALPPRSSTAIPAALASQCVEATIPNVPRSSGRVVKVLIRRFPPPSVSDVAARLPSIDRPAGGVDEAGGARAQERDHAGDLLRRAEAAQRQLAPDERGDALGVGLLAPVPRAALEDDRAGCDAVDRDPFGADLASKRRDEADLGRLGGVVRGRA